MATQSLPTESSGPLLATQSPGVTTGAIYYVDSVNGDDTNAGTNRAKPKASVFGASGAFASATSSNGDYVYCEPSHAETISSAYTWSKIGITLVGLGTSTTKATFTSSVAGVAVLLTGVNNNVHNIQFAASTAATTARISITTGSGSWLHGLTFAVGANDNVDSILINGADNCLLSSIDMTVAAEAVSGTTQCGITVTGAAIGNRFRDLSFDGGAYGWSQTAFEIDDATADDWLIERLTLANYSWFKVTASGGSGSFSGVTKDSTSGWSIVD